MFRRLLVASLAVRRARLLLALTAVSLGVAIATTLATLALQVSGDLARTLRASGPNFVVVPKGARLAFDVPGLPVTPGGAGLPPGAVAAIKRSYWRNNVLAAAPEATTIARVQGVRATLVGTWFARAVATADGPWAAGLVALRPNWKVSGRWPREDADEIAVGAALAAEARVGVGDRIRVEGAKATELTVVGIVSAGGLDDRRAWAPVERVWTLADRDGFDRVWVSALVLPPPKRPPPDPRLDPKGYERFSCAAYPGNVAAEMAQAVPGSEAVPLAEVLGGEARVVSRLDRLMMILALAAIAASTLGLLSTSNAGVLERARELALLRAIGAHRGQIAALLLAESLLVALGGGVLGWALGTAAAAGIRGGTFAAGAAPQAMLLPFALVLALAVGVVGTLGALRLALRLEPATVLRG